jgi:hypothetical protein
MMKIVEYVAWHLMAAVLTANYREMIAHLVIQSLQVKYFFTDVCKPIILS